MIELEGYRVEKRLGSTAQSDVYVGVTVDDELPVVIKVYKRPCASVEVSRANREFLLLRELTGTAGIPRAVEAALIGNQPAIVTERCPGQSLASVLRQGGQAGVEVGAFLRIAQQLSEVLAVVHQAKIIHRDISPANILVEPETLETTLIDFGIADKLGRAQTYHDAPSEAAGSWVYAAPEQSGRIDRGVDFRTDLYSLGAVLYELLTGRPPFQSEDPMELILAHLTRLPEPPIHVVPQTPQLLSDLVLKLLAKDPDARYQRAFGVHHDLAKCEEVWQKDGRLPAELVLGRHDGPLRVRFPAALFGREREERLLRDALARAAARRSQLVRIGGPSGIGKSALVGTLREVMNDQGGHVIWAKFDLAGSKRPYSALSSALDRWVSQILIGSEEYLTTWRTEIEQAVGNLLPVLPDLAPDFRIVLGELKPAPKLDVPRTRDRLATAFQRLVMGIATPAHPLVLVLDDVQWIDPETLALVASLGHTEAGMALVLVYTHRESQPPRGVAHSIEALCDAGFALEEIELARLSEDDATALIAAALERDDAGARSLARLLEQKTENNPFLIQRFVESLVESGHIRFDGESGWVFSEPEIASAQIPDDVAGLIAQRVADLSPEMRRVLVLASCIGDEFEVGVLAQLSRDPRPSIELALYALGDRGLISPCQAGFRFVHDRVREAANAWLTEQERQVVHSGVAHLLLERTSDEQLPSQLFTIVEHFDRAIALVEPELRVRVLELHLLAAERALAGGAAAAAGRYLEMARALYRPSDWDDAPDRCFTLWLESANTALHTREYTAALEFVEELLKRPLDEFKRGRVGHVRILAEEALSTAGAMKVALAELARTGVRWPLNPSLLQTWLAVIRAEWRLWLRPPERLLDASPQAMPERIVARMLVLASASTIFASMNSRLACFAAAESVWVMSKYGVLTHATYGLAGLGGQRFVVTRNPKMSLRLAAGARAALSKPPADLPSAIAGIYRGPYIIAMLIEVWTQPRMKALAGIPKIADQALEAGDHPWAVAAAYQYVYYQALSGVALDVCLETLHPFERRIGSAGIFQREVILTRRLIELLQSGEAIASVCPLISERPPARGIAGGLQQSTLAMQVACVMGEFEWAFEEGEVIHEQPLECPNLSYVVDYCLFRGLAASALATSPLRWRRARSITKRMHRWLRAFARYGPDYVGPATFIAAERARLRGRTERALDLYGACQRKSESSGYVHHAALACEREASLLRSLHREASARERMARAIELYREWGASAKVAALEQRPVG